MSPGGKGQASWGSAPTGAGRPPSTLHFSFHLPAVAFRTPMQLPSLPHLIFPSFLSYEIQAVTFW